MNDLEIQLVLRYVDEYLPEPSSTFSKRLFKERSYSRWAAYEIVNRLMDHPFDQVDVIIESFIFEMIRNSYVAKNPKTADMFSAAQDTAEDILCLLT